MSQETNALTIVRLNYVSIGTLGELEDYIEDQDQTITMAKERLRTLVVMTEPQKFCGENDPLNFVESEYQNWMEMLEEALENRLRAELIRDNWENMTNKSHHPILKPHTYKMREMCCIDGDFVKLYDENDNLIHNDPLY